MPKQSITKRTAKQQAFKRWTLLTVLLIGGAVLGYLAWPYASFMTDRNQLRTIILGAGPLAPLVFIFLQTLQVVIAPVPGTVISLAGGYIFEALWATVYAMIGTTIGFWIVFVVSKRYGRRVMKYFIAEEKISKYDKLATSKGAFAFIAVGFLFPFIPDPILGYLAGTTPIPTRVLMVICIIMRLPGTIMTSLVGSQFGQGNYKTVVVLLAVLIVLLVLGLIFYKQISQATDKIYRLAVREQKEDQQYRQKIESIRAERRQKRRRRLKRTVKKASKKIRLAK